MSMNPFRLAGDMSHVFSIIVLLLRLRVAKNAQGTIVRSKDIQGSEDRIQLGREALSLFCWLSLRSVCWY